MNPGDLVIYRSRMGGKRFTRCLGIITEEVEIITKGRSGITDPRNSEYRWFKILIPGAGIKLACDHYLEVVP